MATKAKSNILDSVIEKIWNDLETNQMTLSEIKEKHSLKSLTREKLESKLARLMSNKKLSSDDFTKRIDNISKSYIGSKRKNPKFNEKNGLVIPARFFSDMGIKGGQRFEVKVESNDKITLTKTDKES